MEALTLSKPQQKFARDFQSWYKQPLFMFMQLPAAWFMGVRLRQLDGSSAKVSLPYRWSSKNPFKSIYFAAQAAAAELSTGALAMLHIKGKGRVSMLVADMRAEFTKKAKGRTFFSCTEGEKIQQAVVRALETGEGQTVTVKSEGQLQDGTIVSTFYFTWTFKKK